MRPPQEVPAPAQTRPPLLNTDVTSLDPDAMDEDSFREGLELLEQLEARASNPTRNPTPCLPMARW